MKGNVIEVPVKYPNRMRCKWSINEQQPVLLNFTHFSLEECEDCICDYVKVADGPRMCGYNIPDAVHISGKTTITFKSDLSVSKKGFKVGIYRHAETKPVATGLYKNNTP